MIRASVVGAAGFVGGELMRWIQSHPDFELGQATSERFAGQVVHRRHPHLRQLGPMRFQSLEQLEPCDLLFCALPHGHTARRMPEFEGLAGRLVDCSADFRLRSAERYREWYGEDHPSPERLAHFRYGLPEVNRTDLIDARFVSGVGCNATAVQLALLPLVREELLEPRQAVIADLKVGSSEGGAQASEASHHPIRTGCVRTFAPTGHRHVAEVQQSFPGLEVQMTVTSIQMVRGVLATCHGTLREGIDERKVLRAYQRFASTEPFVDLVCERAGRYRFPEPKNVAGTNRAQVGFAVDADSRRIVALAAIDNLGKGAAGTAVQCANLMVGLDECTGLDFGGLHPL